MSFLVLEINEVDAELVLSLVVKINIIIMHFRSPSYFV